MKKYIIFLLILIGFICISTVSATDNATNVVEGNDLISEEVDLDNEIISLNDGEEDYSHTCEKNENELSYSSENQFILSNTKVATHININFEKDYDVYEISVLDENNNKLMQDINIYINGVEYTSFGFPVEIENPFNEYAYGYKTYNIEFKGDGDYLPSRKSFTISSLTFKHGSHKITLTKSQYDTLKKNKYVDLWLDTYKYHKIFKKFKKKKVKCKKYTPYKFIGEGVFSLSDPYAQSKAYQKGISLIKKAKQFARNKKLKIYDKKIKNNIRNGNVYIKFYVKFYKIGNIIKKVPVYGKKKYRQWALFEYDKSIKYYQWGITDNYYDYYNPISSFTLY